MASLGNLAWCRLNDDDVRFTVIPEKGSQVWSVLKIDTVFDAYTCVSASPQNTINLEVPIQALQRALKSALGASSAQVRLTKKGNIPMLSLTIVTSSFARGNGVVARPPAYNASGVDEEFGEFDFNVDFEEEGFGGSLRERETVVTQDIPVKVLTAQTVEGLLEPRTQEPDVHIYLPNLAQVKSISERFTRLAMSSKSASSSTASPRLELSANMHGSFKIAIKSDALAISSVWTGLTHPELDPSIYENGTEGIQSHPSVRMKELGGADGQNEAGWSKVRIDGKDWSRVLSVGRLSARVIACFINEMGLILYVYLPSEDEGADESCLTVSVSSVRLRLPDQIAVLHRIVQRVSSSDKR